MLGLHLIATGVDMQSTARTGDTPRSYAVCEGATVGIEKRHSNQRCNLFATELPEFGQLCQQSSAGAKLQGSGECPASVRLGMSKVL